MKKIIFGLMTLASMSTYAGPEQCLVNMTQLYSDNAQTAKIISDGLDKRGYSITNAKGAFTMSTDYRYRDRVGGSKQLLNFSLVGQCDEKKVEVRQDFEVTETYFGYVGRNKAAIQFLKSTPKCPCL